MPTKKTGALNPKPKMTLNEFFNYLAGMSHLTEVRKWLRDGVLEGASCPITAVCKSKTHAHYDVGDAEKAAKKLGLNSEVAKKIIKAADGNTTGIYGKYRKRLLKAVRLNNVE